MVVARTLSTSFYRAATIVAVLVAGAVSAASEEPSVSARTVESAAVPRTVESAAVPGDGEAEGRRRDPGRTPRPTGPDREESVPRPKDIVDASDLARE